MGAVFGKRKKTEMCVRLHKHARIACEPSSWNAKVNAKSPQKTRRIPGPFFSRKNVEMTKTYPRKVSKWVRVFRANVPWAPLWAQLVPHSVLEDEKLAQSGPRVPTELKISLKSNTEGPQNIKKCFQKCIFGGTWPGGLRGALSIIQSDT